ncbi:MAG: hypothetical protein AB7G37_03445 [Solirubrobacteraceae bacterium]
MNLAQLRARVDARSGIAVAASEVDASINEALSVLSLEERWPWLRASAGATFDVDEPVDLPADLAQLVSVTADGHRYSLVAPADVTVARVYSDRQRLAAVQNGALILWPAPAVGAELVVDYISMEKHLVDDTDEPHLPDAYSQAVIHLAISLVQDRAPEMARSAAAHSSSYDGWVRRMRRGTLAKGPLRVRARTDGI